MIVVKVGGGDEIDLDAVCDDIAALLKEGVELVLVHGGSKETNRVAEALGHPPRFVTSPSGYTSRHTDRKALEIFEMVYCGSANKGIVERLQQRGVNALGMSGLDGRLWQGRRKKAIKIVEDGRTQVLRDSYTGTVDTVDADLLRALLGRGLLPVLTPPAVSEDGEAMNVDGDRAAGATAAALGAEALLLLSDVPGVMQDIHDPASLQATLPFGILEDPPEFVAGRMRIKLRGASEALAGGVGRVVIGDGRGPHAVRNALAGAGTTLRKDT